MYKFAFVNLLKNVCRVYCCLIIAVWLYAVTTGLGTKVYFISEQGLEMLQYETHFSSFSC